MIIKNQVIDVLHGKELKTFGLLHISNSIIRELDFLTVEFSDKVIIENCIIQNMQIHCCWFSKGAVISNNQVLSFVDYQMGGHNLEPIIISGSVFHEFFNFFDCQFGEVIEVRNNIFLKGCNLLGNTEEGFKNVFDNGYKVENNLGSINMDSVGFD